MSEPPIERTYCVVNTLKTLKPQQVKQFSYFVRRTMHSTNYELFTVFVIECVYFSSSFLLLIAINMLKIFVSGLQYVKELNNRSVTSANWNMHTNKSPII